MSSGELGRLRAIAGGALLVLAGTLYLVLEATAALAWTDPVYDYAVNFISDLGNPVCPDVFDGRVICSPLHHALDAADILQGVLLLIAALILLPIAISPRLRATVATLAALHAAGMVTIAFFHQTSGGYGDGELLVHVVGATAALVTGNVMAIVAGASWRLLGARPWYRGVSIGLGILGLAGYVALLAIPPLFAAAGGVPERVAVYAPMAWEMMTGVALIAAATRRPDTTEDRPEGRSSRLGARDNGIGGDGGN